MASGGSDGKASSWNAGDLGLHPWVRKIPWRRKWQSTPALLPGKLHGWRSLIGYSPWGCKESDTTERLSPVLSCPGGSDGKESACNAGKLDLIPGLGRAPGEGNGNPCQYPCLEKSHGQKSLVGCSPMDWEELDTTDQLTLSDFHPVFIFP